MRYYNVFLKAYGLYGIISPVRLSDTTQKDTDTKKVTLRIGEEGVEEEVKNSKKNIIRSPLFRYPINGIYMLLICCILIWPIPYVIYKSIVEKDARYVTSNISLLLFFSQYIFGLLYYRSEHFTRITKRYKIYSKVIILGFVLGLCLTIGLCVMGSLLIAFDINVNIFTEFYDESPLIGKIFILIGFNIYIFYAYNILFSNFLIFGMVFLLHNYSIKKYTKTLETYIDNSDPDLRIDDIVKDYSELKAQHTKAVVSMNNIFSSVIVLGGLISYFILINFESKFVGVFHYIEMGCFLFLMILYIYINSRVVLSVSGIIALINSPRMASRYLSSNTLTVMGDTYDTDDTEMNNMDLEELALRSSIKSSENVNISHWLVLNTKLGGAWENFKILGFDMDNNNLIYKAGVVITGLIMMFNLNERLGF